MIVWFSSALKLTNNSFALYHLFLLYVCPFGGSTWQPWAASHSTATLSFGSCLDKISLDNAQPCLINVPCLPQTLLLFTSITVCKHSIEPSTWGRKREIECSYTFLPKMTNGSRMWDKEASDNLLSWNRKCFILVLEVPSLIQNYIFHWQSEDFKRHIFESKVSSRRTRLENVSSKTFSEQDHQLINIFIFFLLATILASFWIPLCFQL